jgi:hypothetical protein
MTSVAATYVSSITAVETIDSASAPFASASDKTITHTGLNKTASLTGATTPPVTKHAANELTLSSGAGTLDLRALVGTNGGAVDGNGLKVQCIKFVNKSTNANSMTIGEGASDGYELCGNAWSVTLAPGQEFLFYGNDATPDIGAAAKDIDIAGTGSQVLQYQVVMG